MRGGQLAWARRKGADPASPGLLAAEYWVDLLTLMSELPAILGQTATLSSRTAEGGHVTRSGLVVRVERCAGDHRVARHRLQRRRRMASGM